MKQEETNKKAGRVPIFRRVILGFAQHLAAALIMMLTAMILFNSFISVNTMNGQKTYRLNPLSQKTNFEESDIFEDLFRGAVKDVVKLAIIRDQLEENGKFAPKKVIDVTEFMRTYGERGKDYGTTIAEYKLEDLITWNEILKNENLGYSDRVWSMHDFVTKYGEIDSPKFFELDGNDLKFRGFVKEEDNRSEDVLNRIKNLMESKTPEMLEDMAFAYIIAKADNGVCGIWPNREDDASISVTVKSVNDEKHKTIDGKSKYQLADNWVDFMKVQQCIVETCEQLAENYELYRNCINLYQEGNGNLKYVIRSKTADDQDVTYTNSSRFADMPAEKITEEFQEYRKYLIYDQNSLDDMGTSSITKKEILEELRLDHYERPEDVCIWIAIDSSYENTGDVFYQANEIFEKFVPYVVGIIATLIILGLFWIGTGIYLTVTAGVVYYEDKQIGHYLNRFDHIWFEFMLIMTGIFGFCAYRGFLYLKQITDESYATRIEKGSEMVQNMLHPIASYALYGFLFSLIIAMLGYSFIRRLKVGNLYKDSALHATITGLKRFFGFILGHQNSMISVLIPYNLFLLSNIAAIVGAYTVKLFPLKIVIIVAAIIFDTLIGMFLFRNNAEHIDIVEGINRIRAGEVEYKLDTEKLSRTNKTLAEAVNNIGEGIDNAVKTSMKDERLKTDLITNVSHDIKTPLTSIINYVDLLKRQHITQEPAKEYIDILESKALRLKDLTDDLVEASKISSGSIILNLEVLDLAELMKQTMGELSDKLEENHLKLVADITKEPAIVYGDSRRMWRIMENLFQNICKYAMEGTRVYTEITVDAEKVYLKLKNVSKAQMNIHADELTERFIRGDSSRSTEGSGLGLFIAKSLTNAQGGNFEIQLDGDLFKVNIDFPFYHAPVSEPKEEGLNQESSENKEQKKAETNKGGEKRGRSKKKKEDSQKNEDNSPS